MIELNPAESSSDVKVAEKSAKKHFLKNKVILIPILIIVADLIIAGVLLSLAARSASKVATEVQSAYDQRQQTNQTELAKNIPAVTAADHLKGSLAAPVKIVIYSDLDCSFCQSLHLTLNEVVKNYTGDQVALVFRNFPLTNLHPYANAKAALAECAADLGGNEKFWKFLDLAFQNQNPQTDETALATLASTTLGLNKSKLTQCVKDQKFDQKISAESFNAIESGAEGTPFVVTIANNSYTPMSGDIPAETIKGLIDGALK